MAESNHKQIWLTLAGSSDRVVQLLTMGLVTVSGLSSFFQTEQLSQQSLRDRDKAVGEIHHLYERVDDFETRQKQALANQQQILELLQKSKTP